MINSPPNAARYLRQPGISSDPLVLTINGEAELIIRDPTSFRLLLTLAERVETIDAIRNGLKEADEGLGRPLDEVFDELEAELRAKPKA